MAERVVSPTIRGQARSRSKLRELARILTSAQSEGAEIREDKAREGSGAEAYLNSPLSTRTERHAVFGGRCAAAAVGW